MKEVWKNVFHGIITKALVFYQKGNWKKYLYKKLPILEVPLLLDQLIPLLLEYKELHQLFLSLEFCTYHKCWGITYIHYARMHNKMCTRLIIFIQRFKKLLTRKSEMLETLLILIPHIDLPTANQALLVFLPIKYNKDISLLVHDTNRY